MTKTLFLPGAGGSASFWQPVADLVAIGGPSVLLSWPGLGHEPPATDVNSIDDLVEIVRAELGEPSNLVAQSMGGVVAIKAALAAPGKVRRLVLAVTSGGMRADELRAVDWRPDYRRAFPSAAAWITEVTEDLSPLLPRITVPVLLLWGDNDPISPPAIGERFRSLLPNARLEVIRGGDHDLARTHAVEVAALIAAHVKLPAGEVL